MSRVCASLDEVVERRADVLIQWLPLPVLKARRHLHEVPRRGHVSTTARVTAIGCADDGYRQLVELEVIGIRGLNL